MFILFLYDPHAIIVYCLTLTILSICFYLSICLSLSPLPFPLSLSLSHCLSPSLHSTLSMCISMSLCVFLYVSFLAVLYVSQVAKPQRVDDAAVALVGCMCHSTENLLNYYETSMARTSVSGRFLLAYSSIHILTTYFLRANHINLHNFVSYL